ncbi:hypothetical protein PPL_06676 [Heterostelium album PN500]|uniref:F-box domain-containing protein n=1 Tax=Heterostelium pallidum (strain ATCC 26659 / Pp 5 / PN500) TaxID=670386 RepID=D3BFE3_HETP5|nr:hypothetical protein PPL_06676 [Heterostelium album PN500]EFA79857.1 hypothetical protein PPL_06676 [Heterostelium album PN500]|eukprot:XP_020431978.1 hypothetical protein PPL_06676 [Heterostelium album PN500]
MLNQKQQIEISQLIKSCNGNHLIFSIPLEVLSSILLFLEPLDLIHLSESCKLFNFYLNNSWIWNQLLEQSIPFIYQSIYHSNRTPLCSTDDQIYNKDENEGLEWLNNNSKIIKSFLVLNNKETQENRIINKFVKSISTNNLISQNNNNSSLLKVSFDLLNYLIKDVEHDNYKKFVIQIPAILSISKNKIQDQELQKSILILFSNILYDKEALNIFGNNGGLTWLSKISNIHKDNRFFNSMFIFIHYKTILSYSLKLKEKDVLISLIEVLKKNYNNEKMHFNGVLSLTHLSNSKYFVEVFKKNGVIGYILSLIQKYFDNPMMVEYCLILLTNMTFNSSDCCKKIVKEDGLPILLHTMKIENKKVQFLSNKSVFNILYYINLARNRQQDDQDSQNYQSILDLLEKKLDNPNIYLFKYEIPTY